MTIEKFVQWLNSTQDPNTPLDDDKVLELLDEARSEWREDPW